MFECPRYFNDTWVGFVSVQRLTLDFYDKLCLEDLRNATNFINVFIIFAGLQLLPILIIKDL